MMPLLDQLELFPIAGENEIDSTVKLLSQYKRMRSYINDFESNPKSSGDPSYYKRYCEIVSYIERAHRLIVDDEVKRVIEQRFFKTNKRKITVALFRNSMSESTVDRRIDEGIESIANTLKMWNLI